MIQFGTFNSAHSGLTNIRVISSSEAAEPPTSTGGVRSARGAVLRRREKQVGDIINMKGDWALAEWFPNFSASRFTAAVNASMVGFILSNSSSKSCRRRLAQGAWYQALVFYGVSAAGNFLLIIPRPGLSGVSDATGKQWNVGDIPSRSGCQLFSATCFAASLPETMNPTK